MDQPPLVFSAFAAVVIWAALWACAAVWIVLARRLWLGLPVLRVEPRRQVPWHGIDLAMILAVYVTCMSALYALSQVVLSPEAREPLLAGQPDSAHTIVRLFTQGDIWMIVLCVVGAVVVAPLAEEILFRLFLQGWLEKLDRRLRRRLPWLRRRVVWGIWPVVAGAAVFALPHIRFETPQYSVEFLSFLVIGNAAAQLTTAAFAVALAVGLRGATAADLGFVPSRLRRDVGIGLAAFAGVAAPIYAAQVSLPRILPEQVVPDPFVLFPFALVLGTLYCRTHRLAPSITLHAALNATSLAMLWLMLR